MIIVELTPFHAVEVIEWCRDRVRFVTRMDSIAEGLSSQATGFENEKNVNMWHVGKNTVIESLSPRVRRKRF